MMATPIRDADIQAQACRTLAGVTGSPTLDMPVKVSVRDGVITVSGNAATASAAGSICARLRQIPGVVGVVDRLVDDESLLPAVRQKLAQHTASADLRKSHVVLGAVYLDWNLREPEREHQLRDILLSIMGVRTVIQGGWSRAQELERSFLSSGRSGRSKQARDN